MSSLSRGGLAERAQYLFQRQSTGLTLWEKDMALQVERPKTYPPVPPDLSLRILDVVYVSSIASLQRSQSVPRMSIVRCAKVHKGSAAGSVTVLLDFGAPGTTAAQIHSLEEIKDGRDVRVWVPWNSSDASAEDLRKFGALPRDGTVLFCTRFRIV